MSSPKSEMRPTPVPLKFALIAQLIFMAPAAATQLTPHDDSVVQASFDRPSSEMSPSDREEHDRVMHRLDSMQAANGGPLYVSPDGRSRIYRLDTTPAHVRLDWITYVLFMAPMVAGTLLGVVYMRIFRSSRHERGLRAHFLAHMDGLMDTGVPPTLDDITAIANSIYRESGYNRTALIEDHLARTVSSETTLTDDARRRRVETDRALLSDSTADDPFSGLPDEQKRLLRNARFAIERGDEGGAVFNLDELRSVLVVSNAAYSRAARTNRLAVPLAVIGLALTLLFGVVGSWTTIARIVASSRKTPTEAHAPSQPSQSESTGHRDGTK